MIIIQNLPYSLGNVKIDNRKKVSRPGGAGKSQILFFPHPDQFTRLPLDFDYPDLVYAAGGNVEVSSWR